MSDWRPIETAPVSLAESFAERKTVLIWIVGKVSYMAIGYKFRGRWWSEWSGTDDAWIQGEVTLWQPLPDPPEAKA